MVFILMPSASIMSYTSMALLVSPLFTQASNKHPYVTSLGRMFFFLRNVLKISKALSRKPVLPYPLMRIPKVTEEGTILLLSIVCYASSAFLMSLNLTHASIKQLNSTSSGCNPSFWRSSSKEKALAREFGFLSRFVFFMPFIRVE